VRRHDRPGIRDESESGEDVITDNDHNGCCNAKCALSTLGQLLGAFVTVIFEITVAVAQEA
jgi:hypothetical protein